MTVHCKLCGRENCCPAYHMPPGGDSSTDCKVDLSTGRLLPKHSHYFRDVSKLDSIDIYRLLLLFDVTDPCLQHAVKKLLVAGGRGGGKDISRDVQEAIDTLARWQAMRAEESRVPHP